GLRLSAPFEASVAPRLPSTAPTLHDVLADADDQYGRDGTERMVPPAAPSRPTSSRRRVPLVKTLSLIKELSDELVKIQKMTISKPASAGERVTCFCCGAEVPIGKADAHARKKCLRVLPSVLSPTSVDDHRCRRESRQ
ncbi:hypothetical protein FOZ63_024803, partial [Perkinsus olseni]